MRQFVFTRHAESTANVGHVLSTDPARPIALARRGQAQARRLGEQLAGLDIQLAIVTSFLRTQETAEIALKGRPVPMLVEPDLDEIRAGVFDGKPIQAYWAWKELHSRSDAFPHGESVDAAMLRYASALHRLLNRNETCTLIVTHELAVRWIANTETEIAHAVPLTLDEQALRRAARRLTARAAA